MFDFQLVSGRSRVLLTVILNHCALNEIATVWCVDSTGNAFPYPSYSRPHYLSSSYHSAPVPKPCVVLRIQKNRPNLAQEL
jgi:hypothetical protein